METGFAEGYAVGRDGSSGNGNGFGMGGWGDLAALIVVAGLFGWGRGGFGGNNGGGYCCPSYGGGYVTNDELQMGFFRNDVSDKLDGINYGIANASFTLNNTMTNGFAGVQQSLCQGFSGVNTALVTQGYETRGAITDIGYGIKDCCCTTQRAIDGVNYNIATQFGNLNTTLCGLGRDIIENQNANYRAIHEELVANKIEAKNERIAELQDALYRADLKASQSAQTLDLKYYIDKLNPNRCPEPAYIVQPPQPVTFPTNCCGTVNYASYGNNCGCC